MKITLFASSPLALPLIHHLHTQGSLACVIVAGQNSPDNQILLQNIAHLQIPYAIYDEQNPTVIVEALSQIESSLAIVFTFSFKLPQSIIKHFKEHIYNIHASPLPNYRGSQPLFWQLRNGETKSALTIHQLTQRFDSGDIMMQKPFTIHPKDTYGILSGIVSQMATPLVAEFIEQFKYITHSPQQGEPSFAPKVEHQDIIINWKSMDSNSIINLIRASNPIFGGAQMQWKGASIGILEATVVDITNFGLEAGTLLHIGYPEGLIVATIDGAIRLDVVAMPDGYFSGVTFATRFGVDAGERFD